MAKILQQQIADELGLSLATVSLALSNKYGVNEETRKKVLIKATSIGYKLKVKKSLKTNIIAVLVDDISYFSDTTYWSEVLRGIESVVYENNAVLKIFITKRNKNYVTSEILKERMNGVILLNQDKEIVDLFNKTDTPAVQLDCRTDLCSTIDHVLANNYQGASLMAEYLYKNNHKNILFVGNIKCSLSFKQRIDSFHNTLSSFNDNMVNFYRVGDNDNNECLFDIESVLNFIKLHKEITAIATANDRIAKELYLLLKKENYKIPKNFSMIGFDGDNSYINLESDLTLTTIKVPRKELGMRSADILIKRMKGLERYHETIMLNCSLLVGNSVKLCEDKNDN